MDEVDRGAPEKDEVTTMKKVIAWMMLAGMAGVVGVGGCSDDAPGGDGRREQEEVCSLGYGACINNCNKQALGDSCIRCCGRKNTGCRIVASYGFEDCFK